MKGFGSAQFDRRRYPRLDFSLPLAFQISDDPQAPEGVSANISLGGMMAFLPGSVEQGRIIDITMLLPLGNEKHTCKAKAEVVWARQGNFESGWACQVGLRFVEMPEAASTIWKRFLIEWQGEKQ
ncbi:PilZ domain-containing protein [bacterium]|nr:PilZ domain-containing protein [bacterium]